MFKDEAGRLIISKFVGLRAKLYSFKVLKTAAEIFEEKKCKGTKKAVVKKHLTFDDYKRCLFNNVNQMRSMNVLRSHNHEIFAETVNKVALSYSDDKKLFARMVSTHIRTVISVYKVFGGNSVSLGTT